MIPTIISVRLSVDQRNKDGKDTIYFWHHKISFTVDNNVSNAFFRICSLTNSILPRRKIILEKYLIMERGRIHFVVAMVRAPLHSGSRVLIEHFQRLKYLRVNSKWLREPAITAQQTDKKTTTLHHHHRHHHRWTPSIARFCFDLISWLEFFRRNIGKNTKSSRSKPKCHQCAWIYYASEFLPFYLFTRFFFLSLSFRLPISEWDRAEGVQSQKRTAFNTHISGFDFTMIMIVINIEHGFCIKFHILLNFPYFPVFVVRTAVE